MSVTSKAHIVPLSLTTYSIADYGGEMLGAWLFKLPGVEFDLKKFCWLSVLLPDPYGFVVSAKSPFKSVEELKGVQGFKFGSVTQVGVTRWLLP